ncbi:porin [Azomonas macrocytogenes]|uniref:Phosphate-selective porin n=1 Tax=Azomonas macrocytogenes TaxID=69962 RepID=A0A839T5F5_AZOMA|nr:porin [Azomonas macrocytogenes]MBB3103165.1 phosphate-selective porin [Azomonas macrocytogenes]
MELYVDRKTKQIFAEPGPNRVKLGLFQQVDPLQTASLSDEPSDAKALADELARMQQNLALKQRELDARLDQIAKVSAPKQSSSSKKTWLDTMSIRGYVQVRNNMTLGGDRHIRHQADRSVGENTNFIIRRARLVFSGDVSDRLSYYFQPDFASSSGDTGNIAQLRDAYGDIHLTTDRVHRLRVGQSKIPFGFENLQSSQNRVALDRADAINSCCKDERDQGVFYYYTPQDKQEMFKYLTSNNLKGSGNYGLFALGVYNGTGANRSENNSSLHVVSRFTYPMKLDNGQIIEAGISAHTGTFKPNRSAIGGITPTARSKTDGFSDKRVGLHAVLYPQPFGLQAEWNWGRGPQLNDERTEIKESSLDGGYVQAMYKIDNLGGRFGTLIPFVKWQYFDGGQKFETNAPRNKVNDWELGFEWQPVPEIEFTAYYSALDRTNVQSSPYEKYNSDLLRMQLQYNF